jgi:glycosyltransferase involved in cell wall biosynthesis
MKITVIVCTHNPRKDYFERTLEGLSCQTLSQDLWELIVVDNNSNPPVELHEAERFPKLRVVQESEAGLTLARIRGVSESIGDLLVFVDDDNVLQTDYLEVGLRLAERHPCLGAWGGSSPGEFEVQVPDIMAKHLEYIGVREVTKAQWGNVLTGDLPKPIGAGMFVRRDVALRWMTMLNEDVARRDLDRIGTGLGGSGDHDLALASTLLGLGFGVFPELRLTHLIAAFRLEKDYFLKLVRGTMCSAMILAYLWGMKQPMRSGWYYALQNIDYRFRHLLKPRSYPMHRLEFRRAHLNGRKDGLKAVREISEQV